MICVHTYHSHQESFSFCTRFWCLLCHLLCHLLLPLRRPAKHSRHSVCHVIMNQRHIILTHRQTGRHTHTHIHTHKHTHARLCIHAYILCKDIVIWNPWIVLTLFSTCRWHAIAYTFCGVSVLDTIHRVNSLCVNRVILDISRARDISLTCVR